MTVGCKGEFDAITQWRKGGFGGMTGRLVLGGGLDCKRLDSRFRGNGGVKGGGKRKVGEIEDGYGGRYWI